ncbi:hypothetical protein DF044_31595 [Burkholderia contaminans]|uniref:OmpA-like domain-containing protein n=1 Tax=Burkholderia contaminans TaxID=488447 RepID=A0A3N8P3G6_9BURK|nr:hypothetical protein [Burkholderia contaminans]MCA8155079.1 hypothetical protein [Burkholderia contaminans]RQT05770.1 hypothetical protein DF044_31595 [Burkholderia contaminans]RQT25993.1 hypothetical protein DF037_20080 [Burkholderia contaminans]
MHKLIPAVLVAISNSSFACIAGENIDIYFQVGSAVVSNSEVVRIANWVADQKIGYASHAAKETTLIGGHAEESEHGAQALAQSRLQTGRALLEQLGFLRGTVQASARVYLRGDVDNGRRVEISFLPDCPNKCCTAN